MQIWYLSPFLLAVVVWWVATRKHPDERDKWTWWALGLVSGAVLMFVIVYVAQQNAGETPDRMKMQSQDADRGMTLTLRSDTTIDVLPPTRITQNRSVGIGSLMVTLVSATKTNARIQLEPHDELELFGAPEWLYESNADSGETPMSRIATQLALGKDLSFAFHGRNYRLGLLDIQLPLKGFGSSEFQDLFDAHVVVRLLDVGPYLICSSATSKTRGGNTLAQARCQQGVADRIRHQAVAKPTRLQTVAAPTRHQTVAAPTLRQPLVECHCGAPLMEVTRACELVQTGGQPVHWTSILADQSLDARRDGLPGCHCGKSLDRQSIAIRDRLYFRVDDRAGLS